MIDPIFLFDLESRIAALGELIEQVDLVLAENGQCAVIYVYGADGAEHTFSTDGLPPNFSEGEYRAALQWRGERTTMFH